MMKIASSLLCLLLLTATPLHAATIPPGNYVCFGMSMGTYLRMGNVEILSGDTFRVGDSKPYPYSYDAATGKIVWQGSLFMGMASEFSTKDKKPLIHIRYKTKDLIHALDYRCRVQQ